MGDGKLPTPGEADRGKIGLGRVEEEPESDQNLTVAELVCELLYAGKTRAEIAGYDDAFMRWVFCRRRDEQGNLVRVPDGLPRWVAKHLNSQGHWVIRDPQPLGSAFRQVMKQHGLSDDQQQQAWQSWRRENPNYGEGG